MGLLLRVAAQHDEFTPREHTGPCLVCSEFKVSPAALSSPHPPVTPLPRDLTCPLVDFLRTPPAPKKGSSRGCPLALRCAVLAVVQLLSCARFFATPWTAACQAPLSMGFSRQEFWSRLPFPSPGDLPGPGIEPESPALVGGVFTTELSGKPRCIIGSQTNIYQMNTRMVVGMAGGGICPVT